MIVLLSGGRRVGKSTACLKLLERAQRRGKSVGGFLSVAQFDERGEKTGIELMDPLAGDERLLASTSTPLGGPQVGDYYMSADTLQWGVLRWLWPRSKRGVDLMLIDEIGPLELLRGKGFADILPALYAVTEADCLIVVRPELIDELESRLNATPILRRVVTADNRDDVPEELETLFWGEP